MSDAFNKNIRSSPSTVTFWISLSIGGLAWAAVLFWWFRLDLPFEIAERVPGMDGEPLGAVAQGAAASNIGELFHTSENPPDPSAVTSSWPRFRGADINNINTENIPLRDLSDGIVPPILWTIGMGEGHAAPAVRNGRVYVLDYDEREEADMLRCLSLDTGEEMWRRGYKIKVRRNHGMSRTVPAVTDSAAVTIGPLCHVMAVHAVTGDLLWGIDLVSEYGTTVPLWYTGQCPLIDDTVAVIAPVGNRALMIGVNVNTGEILWETPNRHGWQMSHSSIIPMVFHGRRMYVYAASGGIAGVAADGGDRGEILFETSDFNQSVIAPSPVELSDNRIFMTAGYGAGSAVFRVDYDPAGNKFSISLTGRHGVREALASEQQTPLYHGGHLYAVLPKDAGARRDQFVCADGRDLLAIKWASGLDNLFGLGPFIIADGKFFVLSDNGVLAVAAVSNRQFEKTGSVKMFDGVDAWGPMALAGGLLLMRDSKRMFCVDMRARR